jgi:hypothetical protein
LSETAFAPIRGWLNAEAPCTPEELGRAILAATAAVREALQA